MLNKQYALNSELRLLTRVYSSGTGSKCNWQQYAINYLMYCLVTTMLYKVYSALYSIVVTSTVTANF